jgi:hypothetical protein
VGSDALGARMEGEKSAKNGGRNDLRLFIDGSRMLNYLHWLNSSRVLQSPLPVIFKVLPSSLS